MNDRYLVGQREQKFHIVLDDDDIVDPDRLGESHLYPSDKILEGWLRGGTDGETAVADCVYLIRAEQRYGNGDGVFTLAEQQAASAAYFTGHVTPGGRERFRQPFQPVADGRWLPCHPAIDGVRSGESDGSCGTAVHRRAEVAVTDINRQAVGTTRSTVVHPAELYVAAKPLGASYFWRAGTPQSIGVMAVLVTLAAIHGNGWQLGAAYSSAGRASVGGDFYDVFPHGDGSWGMAVGDVSGKGPEAAAVMGLAAHTIRAVARFIGSVRPVAARTRVQARTSMRSRTIMFQ